MKIDWSHEVKLPNVESDLEKKVNSLEERLKKLEKDFACSTN